MADFPTYTKILNYSETNQKTVRRTPYQAGYFQQTKRFSNLWMNANVEVLFTNAQYETFLSWYKNDITNGSDSFTFDKYMSGSPSGVQARIVNGQFSVAPLRHHQIDYLVVSLMLEYKT